MTAEETLVAWLREARRVVAFCGAGISAESGIPTFRGAGGLWEGDPVEAVATPEGFAADPRRVWRFYARRQEELPRAQPNPAHRALASMERRYEEALVVTQNVDDLHERAGSRRLIKVHGSIMETLCPACGAVEALAAAVSSAAVEAGELPHCGCGGLLRPNVVWFGELLNPAHFEEIEAFFRRCPAPFTHAGPALLLIIGTSGLVSGGYGLPQLARRFGIRSVEINPEPAFAREVDLVLAEPAGALLGRVWPRVAAA